MMTLQRRCCVTKLRQRPVEQRNLVHCHAMSNLEKASRLAALRQWGLHGPTGAYPHALGAKGGGEALQLQLGEALYPSSNARISFFCHCNDVPFQDFLAESFSVTSSLRFYELSDEVASGALLRGSLNHNLVFVNAIITGSRTATFSQERQINDTDRCLLGRCSGLLRLLLLLLWLAAVAGVEGHGPCTFICCFLKRP